MRIDPYGMISQVYQASKPKATAKTSAASSFGEVYQASAAAKSYQTARTAVASAPDVRADKVAEIKAAMQNGTYNVTAQDLADKLLGQTRTLTF